MRLVSADQVAMHNVSNFIKWCLSLEQLFVNYIMSNHITAWRFGLCGVGVGLCIGACYLCTISAKTFGICWPCFAIYHNSWVIMLDKSRWACIYINACMRRCAAERDADARHLVPFRRILYTVSFKRFILNGSF